MSAPQTLEAIRDERDGRNYPRALLASCESALVFFAAGFHGRQDAFWLADAGLEDVVCVDVDARKLAEMEALYPPSWRFVTANAFDYARELVGHGAEESWDVVSVDCPTDRFDDCARDIGLWCQLAKRAVVLGTGFDTHIPLGTGGLAGWGWQITDVRRRSDYRGGVYWTVLERMV